MSDLQVTWFSFISETRCIYSFLHSINSQQTHWDMSTPAEDTAKAVAGNSDYSFQPI